MLFVSLGVPLSIDYWGGGGVGFQNKGFHFHPQDFQNLPQNSDGYAL